MTNEDFIDAEVIYIGELTRDVLSTIRWRTKDGRLTYIKDMESKHIRNIVLFLTGFGYTKCVAPEPVRLQWLRILNLEWQRRDISNQNGNKRFNLYPESMRNQLHD